MPIQFKSKPGQVISDRMVKKRFDDRVIVGGAPGTPEARHLPLVGTREKPGALAEMGVFSVAGEAAGFEAPQVRWTNPCWVDGATEPKPSTSLFTATSKMNCPSFSLPAGPPKEGGSCLASSKGEDGAQGLRKEGKVYTCDQCYALGANYAQPTVSFSQSVHAFWVQQELDRDPTGVRLAEILIGAISEFARRTTLNKSRGNRLVSELGVWSEKKQRIEVPVSTGSSARTAQIRFADAFTTALPPEFGASDSAAWIQRTLHPKDGYVAGFFRIHDSGDFNVGEKPSRWIPYFQSWVKVAQAFPGVVFWAPTRAHIFKGMREAMVEATRTTPNLILRPSALHVGDAAPMVRGFAPGSTVSLSPLKDEVTHTVQTFAPAGEFSCPVYLPHWDPAAEPTQKDRLRRGETGNWKEVGSCMDAGCRRCWIDRVNGVAYGLH